MNCFLMFMWLLQVAASTNKEIDSHIPNYPSLPPQLMCQLHNVTMHVSGICCFSSSCALEFENVESIVWNPLQADVETDEVYAQMTLQPLSPVINESNYDLNSTTLTLSVFFYSHFFPTCKSIARAKGSLPTSWIRDSQQTTYKLFLQDFDC